MMQAGEGRMTATQDLFREHERALWGLCYRMTGCAADADDLVQETFVRAIEQPPPRLDEPLRPWLVRVATNLSLDHLRRRRRRGYDGPWLPSPAPADAEPPSHEPPLDRAAPDVTTEGRYDLLESVSYAFLVALEALSPLQRAVLVLRDVFDYSVRETADALGVSEPNVKTTHHRARRAMAAYDRARLRPTDELAARTRVALERFLIALGQQDAAAVEAVLAEDVRAISDGGGEFHAARVEVLGRRKTALMYLKLTARRGGAIRVSMQTLNGLPAVVVEAAASAPGDAARFVLRADVDEAGRITALHSVLASRKLTAVRWGAPPA